MSAAASEIYEQGFSVRVFTEEFVLEVNKKRESQHWEFEMCCLLWRENVHVKKKVDPKKKTCLQAKVKKKTHTKKKSDLSHVPEETTIV